MDRRRGAYSAFARLVNQRLSAATQSFSSLMRPDNTTVSPFARNLTKLTPSCGRYFTVNCRSIPLSCTYSGNANGSGVCSAANCSLALRIQSLWDSTNSRTSAGRVRRGTTTSTRPRGKTLIDRRFARPLSRTEKPDTKSGSSTSENRGNCFAALCTAPILWKSMDYCR